MRRSCSGDFNALFSGNGFTYVANGGLIQGQGREYITSPLLKVQSVPVADRETIFFCINGLNGGRPDAEGKCPAP